MHLLISAGNGSIDVVLLRDALLMLVAALLQKMFVQLGVNSDPFKRELDRMSANAMAIGDLPPGGSSSDRSFTSHG